MHYKLRQIPELIIGKEYYVSFGSNKAKRCVLTEIHKDRPELHVSVEVPTGVYYLYADELGITPEQAVLNEVTF